jgi:hypothetical protein
LTWFVLDAQVGASSFHNGSTTAEQKHQKDLRNLPIMNEMLQQYLGLSEHERLSSYWECQGMGKTLAPELADFQHTCAEMFRSTFNPGNSGNAALLLSEAPAEYEAMKRNSPGSREFAHGYQAAESFRGRFIVCTAAQQPLGIAEYDPRRLIGVNQISEDGKSYVSLWGAPRATSEIFCHIEQMAQTQLPASGHGHLSELSATMQGKGTRVDLASLNDSLACFLEVDYLKQYGYLEEAVPGNPTFGRQLGAEAKRVKQPEGFAVVVWGTHGFSVAANGPLMMWSKMEEVRRQFQITHAAQTAFGGIEAVRPETIKGLVEVFGIPFEQEQLDVILSSSQAGTFSWKSQD